MLHVSRNDTRRQADNDISRIILVYKLAFQSVKLGLGLGLKAKILALALKPKSLALPCLALGLLPCGLVNITG